MMYYFAIITPLVAGIIAVYGIFPDILSEHAKKGQRVVAAVLIILGIGTSAWAAYTTAKDQKYLASWQAIEDVHDNVNRVWQDFQTVIIDPDRKDQGAKAVLEAQELITKGRLDQAKEKTDQALRLFKPDMQKLKPLVDEIRKLMDVTTQSNVPTDLKYRTVLFCITLETMARLHSSDTPISPSLLFGSVAADTGGRPENHLILTPEWSEVTWYTGYFRPSDFGLPTRILSVDLGGHLIVDSKKFDEAFLFSRANYLVEWFDRVAR